MDESSFIINFWIWGSTILLPILFFSEITKKTLFKRSIRDKLALFSTGIFFPLSIVLSKLLGDEFINSFKFLNEISTVLDFFDQWLVIIFFILAVIGPKEYRVNYIFAAIFGFYFFLVMTDQNNLINLSVAILDITIGLSDQLIRIFLQDVVGIIKR